MTRIAILTYGTRGDVTPLFCLAAALRDQGFDISLATDVEFAEEARRLGLTTHIYALQLKDLFQSEHGKEAIESEFRVRQQRELNRLYQQRIRDMLDLFWQASQGADLLIYQGDLFAPLHIAEALDISCIMTSAIPNLSPTRAFPLIGAPWIGDFRLFNRMSYWLYPISWFQGAPRVQAWCEETLKIKPPSRFKNYYRRDRRPIPVIYSYSPALAPSPPDWNDATCVSGFWHLAASNGDKVSDELIEFLQNGDPPVYIGFGSTVGIDPKRTGQCIRQALERLRLRAVVNVGWGGAMISELDDRVFTVDEVNYDWLFPRVSAVVCHGGIGTIAYALAHKRPVVTCPFITDQHFWSKRIEALGAGVEAGALRSLEGDALASAIQRALTDESITKNASALGDRIRAERGLDRAIEFIKTHLDRKGYQK